MAELTQFTKDPDATLDYVWDWSEWLGEDTITSHTILPVVGATVDSSSTTASAVTVWLSGGTIGETVLVTCRITTAGGRTDDRTSQFKFRRN